MIAEVIVDVLNAEVDKIFDYKISTPVQVGTRVLVPFGARTIEGYVLAIKQQTQLDNAKLKSIIKADDSPVLLPEMIQLVDFMCAEFNLRKIDAIRLMIPSGLRNNKVKQKVVKFAKIKDVNFDVASLKKSAKNQIECYKFLAQNGQTELSVLNAKFSASSVKKLAEHDAIQIFEVKQNRQVETQFGSIKTNVELTQTQAEVSNAICSAQNQTFLLFGVTGSGKTEVYMNVIKNCLKNGKTAIMLVPEISLTPQVLKHFKTKFGDTVAILHSGLGSGERYDEWFRILNGQAKIVVGARSAIFAPLKNVGVIVIDEEHDTSYFSENNPRFSTIEVAKQRSKFNNCPLVLGSATPSVESFFKAKNGEYQLLQMPERVNKAPMPKFEIVDMLSELKTGNNSCFSRVLIAELCECLKTGKQAMIYLNRRGYQSSVACRDCGNVVKCEQCDVPLVYHKQDKMLKCHYCDARYHILSNCPSCSSQNLRYGAIGTQKVVEELSNLFPKAKIFRMDNDSTRTKQSHQQILTEFANTPSSILVGTQMIAKGHDFPLVTMVGIVDADMGLHFADFRATERAFGLITQVAGRAGRGEYVGKVVLQTYMPKNYTYRCAVNYDYQNFFKHELNIRKVTKFPPYSVIMRVLFSGDDEQKVASQTRLFYENLAALQAKYPQDFIFLKAMKCPIKKIQNKTRYQILMRLAKNNYTNLRQMIYNIHKQTKNKDVISFVEINPQNLS